MTLFIAECDSELWDEKDQDSDLEYDCDNVNSAPIMPSFEDNSVEHEHANNLVLWFIGFFLSLQAKFYFPDSAIDILIKFLYAFIRILSGLSRSTFIDLLSRKLHVMRKKSNIEEKFTKYVVCSNCCDIYNYEDCVSTVGQHKQRKDCISVKYPDHPQRSRRKPCGELLLKSVHFVSGKKLLYPIKVYAYKSLKESLQSLLLRPNFYSCCQEWRIQSEFSLSGCLGDIYAGNIWNDYQQCMGSPFLSEPYSLAFVLNVDWFQPYTHTTSSVGVIYLTVLNLPRTVRYKRENVILVGPHEPGCSKCLQFFPGQVGEKDYSGFDREQWDKRTDKQHRQAVKEVMKCKTKTRRKEVESLLGCRFSCLLDLPYFDAPRMLCIDPMHNLFLGTGKHMLTVWIELDLLSIFMFHVMLVAYLRRSVLVFLALKPTSLKHG